MQLFIILISYGLGLFSCIAVLFILRYMKISSRKNIALEKVLEQLPEHIYWKNKEGVYLGCNTANWKDFGLQSLSDCVGKTDYDIYPKEEADPLRQVDLEIMRTGKPIIVEEGDVTALYLSHKAPLRNQNNEIIGVLGTSIDITSAKKTEMERLAETIEAKTKAKIETEMRQAVTVLSGSIVHDLRTSLATISMMGRNLEKFLPILVHAYELAKDAGLEVTPVRRPHIEILKKFSTDVKKITQEMQEFITQTLKALSRTVSGISKTEDLVSCDSYKCVLQTLSSYPFVDQQRKLVHHTSGYYFTFMGNPVLFIRILTNLIKNALYQIEKNQRGEIWISEEDGDIVNIIRVRDTAGGASREIVSHLFDGYKSHTEGGTGVGLAFCKLTMQNIGGDITCHSVEGDYIEFVLSFPKSSKY